MDKLLKAIIVISLLLLPWQYYYFPRIEAVKADKQMVANLKGSINRFADGREAMFKSLLDLQQQSIGKEQHRLKFMLPSFAKARANLMAPLNNIRAAVPGEWSAVPEGKFKKSGPLVFWPFKFTYIGSISDAIKVIANMEASTQFMLLRHFTIETHESQVDLSGIVELVFHDTGEEVVPEGGVQ